MKKVSVDSIDKLIINHCTCRIQVVLGERAGIKNVNVTIEGALGFVPEPVRKDLDLIYPRS